MLAEAARAFRVMDAEIHWNWKKFAGDPDAIRYAKRDLLTLELALGIFTGRTACVQAGGNVGIFPKYLAQHFEAVYTFEPYPENFTALALNANERNVYAYQAALGADRGLVGLKKQRRDGKPSTHAGVVHVDGAGTVPTLLVDDLDLPVCDFLCLDVEGYEVYALRGALQTIRRCRPAIMIEVSEHASALGFTPEFVREAVRQHNYKQALVRQSDEVWIPE